MRMRSKSVFIGITGAFGSGKSTAAAYFQSKGFLSITLSSFLEEEAKKRKSETTREVLQDIGNEWREKFGKDVLSQKALEYIKKSHVKKVIIDGLRNIGEIELLRKIPGFILLAVVSDRKIRFKRLQKIKRREKLTWELFTRLDYRDLGIEHEEKGLQVASCIALADHFIENNSSLKHFLQRLEKLYGQYVY